MAVTQFYFIVTNVSVDTIKKLLNLLKEKEGIVYILKFILNKFINTHTLKNYLELQEVI